MCNPHRLKRGLVLKMYKFVWLLKTYIGFKIQKVQNLNEKKHTCLNGFELKILITVLLYTAYIKILLHLLMKLHILTLQEFPSMMITETPETTVLS